MDQSGTVESDAVVDPAVLDSVINTPNRVGERVAAASQGIAAVDPATSTDNEETPLLGRGKRSLGANGTGPPGDDRGGKGQETWREFEGLPWWKTPSVFWVVPAFFVIAVAFGGVMVPRINLILELVCRQYASEMVSHSPGFTIAPIISGEDNPQCRTGEVQSRVAQFNLYCQVISGILSAFVSPKLGALSDRYGRKRLIAVAGLGSLTIETLFIIAAKRPEAFPLYTLLLGYALDGLCGSFTTAMAIIHAYATDCSRLDQRSVVFAYFHSCLFVGVAIGPILAGYIIKITGGPLVVFIAALAVHLVFLAFLLFVIPESLSRSRQLAAREKHRRDMDALGPSADWINRVRATNIFEPLKILWPTGPGSSAALRRNLVLLSAVDTIVFGVAMGTYQVIVIYMNYAFGWRDFESGRFVSIVNVCRVFCLLIVLPLLSRLARGKKPAATGQDPSRGRGSDGFDVAVIRVGLLFDTAGYLGYSLSRTGALFTLSGIVSSIGGVASPTLQSSLTKHVGAHQTGQMLGAMGLLHALARVGGPLVFNAIYAATVGGFAQAVFVCLAATFGAAAVCTWFVRPHVFLNDSPPTVDDPAPDGEPSSPVLSPSQI